MPPLHPGEHLINSGVIRARHGEPQHPDRRSGAARPPALGPFHRLVVAALGITWILDGLEVTLAGSVAAALQTSPRLHLTRRAGRPDRQRLSRRRGTGRAVLRPADRPARPQEALQRHARRLSGGHRGDRLLVELRELPVLPLPDRRRHRRRILGDQLGDPGADPGAGARPHRPGDQRQLLDRRGARARWSRCCCSIRRCSAPDIGWRIAFGSGAVLGPLHPLSAPLPAREPALADDRTAATARRQEVVARDRGARDRAARRRAARRRSRRSAAARRSRTRSRSAPSRARLSEALSRPHRARPRADGRAGLHLQRDLLHLRAGADQVLRRARRTRSGSTSCRSRSAISWGRCCSAGCSTRSAASR